MIFALMLPDAAAMLFRLFRYAFSPPLIIDTMLMIFFAAALYAIRLMPIFHADADAALFTRRQRHFPLMPL